jgi:serine/threonine protein kinase
MGTIFQYLDQSGAFCCCNTLSFSLVFYIVNLSTLLSLYWFSQDFRHEVNLLVKLRHPNIVQFLGAVTERKPLMLITEYLRGVYDSISVCYSKFWILFEKGFFYH